MSVEDFAASGRRASGATGDWRDGLAKTEDGIVRKNLFNACVALRDHPALKGRIAYDEFSGCTYVREALPWDERPHRAWTDFDDLAATEWLQSADVRILVGSSVTREATQRVAYENRFHPVLEWLEGLKWDGTERLSGWLTTYLGAPKSPLAAAIGRKFLISAVARIERPGCKVDHMLILEGYQGALKSKSLRTLVGDDWFTDHIADLGTKDSCQDLRGVWVIELSELAAIRPGEVERVKAYISRQVDHYRPSYGRRSIDVPRQCVFIGTTNDTEYLSDPTGGRRYWPVTCTALDPEALARDRDQVWAEAVAAYHAGETWWIDDDQLRRVAQEEQELRRIEDPWEAVVADWLDSPTRANSDGIRIPLELDGGRVAVQQILEHAIARPAERQTKSDQMRVGKILKLLGWSKSRAGKGRARMWEEVGLPSAASEPPSGPGDPPCDPANTEVVRPGGSTQTPRPERGTAEADHLTHLSSCTGYAAETEPMARGGPGGPPGRNGSAEREHVGTCAHCNLAVFADNMVRTESGALLHFPCADLWSREVPF